MFDANDDAKVGYRRSEVLTGPRRRRRWSDAEKVRIVAESLVPGALRLPGGATVAGSAAAGVWLAAEHAMQRGDIITGGTGFRADRH